MLPPPVSRRRFLTTSTAAAVGLSLGLDARGQTTSTGPKMRWGVIGTGNRANAHIPVILSRPDMEIVALCDVMPPHLAKARQRVGGAVRTYTDYQKLLAASDIDAVLITTPGLLHCEMFLAALQAGKHVLCEKPIGLNLKEGLAMKQAAEASDRTVVFGTQLHYSPFYGEIRRQIDAGRIGKPTHQYYRIYRSDWRHDDVWLYPDPKTGKKINWRFSQAASGGVLSEEGCHYFDLLHWMAGAAPETVGCSGGIACYTNDGRDTWDHAMATLRYPGGCIGSLDNCLYAPGHLQMQIVGDEGSLLAEPESMSLVFATRGGGKPQAVPLAPEIGHGIHGAHGKLETAVVRMYDDFITCVREKKQPVVTAALAFQACKTAWLSHLSQDRGGQVRWDALG